MDWQDEIDPIIGMLKASELDLFIKSNYFGETVQFIEKTIDNLYKMGKFAYTERIVYTICVQILERRQLMEKINKTMPDYVKKMKQWEISKIKKFKINEEFLQNIEKAGSHNPTKETQLTQYNQGENTEGEETGEDDLEYAYN